MRLVLPRRVRVPLAVVVLALGALVAVLGSACVRADDRLPPLPFDKYSEVQRKAAREFAADRGKPVFGPFVPLLRSPELMVSATLRHFPD